MPSGRRSEALTRRRFRLREKILASGGDIPQLSFTPAVGKSSWECLLMDRKEEKRCCGDLLQRMHVAEHADPEIAEGLHREPQ